MQRLVNSVDHPVEKFVIINNNGRGQLDQELAELTSKPHEFIEKFYVVTMPGNIGCAGAWNLIIKSTLMSPYWIIVNHDIAFGKGFLLEMKLIHDLRRNLDNQVPFIVFGENKSVSGGFDLFLIPDTTVDRVGLFDENFYPAYAEDMDYAIRLHKERVFQDWVRNSEYFHGDKGYAESGSQTWRTEPELEQKLLRANYINQHEYIREKWGKDFPVWTEGFHGTEKAYDTPFGADDRRFNTSYNLHFARRKFLGF